jgi:hypothetical protein
VWSVAFTQAHEAYGRTGDQAEANRMFLMLMERGMAGVEVAMETTAYIL